MISASSYGTHYRESLLQKLLCSAGKTDAASIALMALADRMRQSGNAVANLVF